MLSTLQIIVHFLPKITIFYLLFTYFSGIPLNSIALLIAIALDIIDYIPIFP